MSESKATPQHFRFQQPRFKQPWFIHDQRWSVLTADCESTDLLRKYCAPKFYRITPDGLGAAELDEFTKGYTVHREISDIALNRPTVRDQSGKVIDFRFTAIIADGGVGKTIITKWIQYRCSQSDSRHVPLRFDLRTLVQRYDLKYESASQGFLKALAKIWHDRLPDPLRRSTNSSHIEEHVRSMARQGTLCLIFDGLDQCSTQDIEALIAILESHEFRNCRFVIAGRPQAFTTNWNALFPKWPWRFVRVEGMNRAHQIRYLGWLADGTTRYHKIPTGARALLANPRVMSYLREHEDFSRIRNASDVYWKAICHLIATGMGRSQKGSLIGLPHGRVAKFNPETQTFEIDEAQIRTAICLLSIIAFETIRFCQKRYASWSPNWETTGKLPSSPDQPPPKYDYNVVKGGEVDRLRRESIKKRCSDRGLDGDFETNWAGITALNSGFLDHGIFDDSVGGLKELVWANRSLHEFLLAYFFANLADEADTYCLWDWLYLKDQYATEDYYWFWQYLCEVGEECRTKERWLNAIRMIYQPSVYRQNEDGSKRIQFAKRSTEMIFRSWWTLDEYIREEGSHGGEASELLNRWQGEFERIRGGEFGPESQETAQQIVDHLLWIDLSKIKRFKMGTKPEKHGVLGLPDKNSASLERTFRSWQERPEEVADYFDRYLQTKGWLAYRERTESYWRELAMRPDRQGAIEEWMEAVRPSNQPEIPYTDLPKEGFQSFALGRHPFSNEYYRIFDPSHGLRRSDLWTEYSTYSEGEDSPAICVSFFDAWVCCRFLYWDGLACELPHEDQWECAAKYGWGWDDWDRRYWWGDDFDAVRDRSRINCKETEYGKALPPSIDRTNPSTIAMDREGLGFSDMLGNVWEWCADPFPVFREPYQRQSEELLRDPSVFRSVRGGCFGDDANNACCSCRYDSVPVYASRRYGFRVARAKPENL